MNTIINVLLLSIVVIAVVAAIGIGGYFIWDLWRGIE